MIKLAHFFLCSGNGGQSGPFCGKTCNVELVLRQGCTALYDSSLYWTVTSKQTLKKILVVEINCFVFLI